MRGKVPQPLGQPNRHFLASGDEQFRRTEKCRPGKGPSSPVGGLVVRMLSIGGAENAAYLAYPPPELKQFETIFRAGHNDTVEMGGRPYFARIAQFLDEVAP